MHDQDQMSKANDCSRAMYTLRSANTTRQGQGRARASLGRAGQGRAGQGRAGQGRAGQTCINQIAFD